MHEMGLPKRLKAIEDNDITASLQRFTHTFNCLKELGIR